MFGNFKERFQNVRHDVTQGWKSIADKAKSVNKKIVRKRTLITDEVVEGEDQCFSCDLETGSEILSKYQKDWAEIHGDSTSSSQEAEKADQIINKALKRTTELRNVMTIFHGEMEKLPDVIKQVQAAAADVDLISTQADVLEELLLELEEVCEKLDYERRKTGQRLKMIIQQQTKLDDLEKLKEDLEIEHEKHTQKKEQLERQESVEKQKVYEDAFLEQMNYYIQFGKTEEPISGLSEPGSSLADIKLEDDFTLDQQLDDFLGPGDEGTNDPSIPAKEPEKGKHRRKKGGGSPKGHKKRHKPKDSKSSDDTTTPLPTETTQLPTDATPLPTETTPLPTETTSLPTETTPLPTDATPLPTESTPLPTESTPLPIETTPLPTETTPLPTDNTPLPTDTTSRGTGDEKDDQIQRLYPSR